DYTYDAGLVRRLYPSSTATPKTATKTATKTAAAKPPKQPTTGTKSSPPKTASSAPAGPPVKWQWPVLGGTPTLTSRPNGGYGLTIGGRLGDEVRAAADGRVVYTGSGLLGYGQLVIVKHNETYLSAYGH